MSNKYYIPLLIGAFLLGGQVCLGAETTKTPEKTQPKLTLTIGNYAESLPYETYSNWLKPEATVFLDPAYKSEFENSRYCGSKSTLLCELLFSSRVKSHLQARSTMAFDEEAAGAFLEDLARRTDSQASDAKFKVEDGHVVAFSPEQKGTKLNKEKSLPLLAAFAKSENAIKSDQTIALPFETTSPTVTAGEINDMGIANLIGQGTSDFKGSPVNRIRNIKAAISRFDGVLIKPGEEFSFVKTLGEVDAEHGYFPELVIKKGVTEPEFGGGICQVSTTVFRAAIYSGLKITARRNHAYPVSYYSPQGMDSTVYVPQPDLRFKNNTPGYILIQPKITGTELTFDFYGTDDGRKTTVDGPKITERQPDGALKATFTQHVFDKDGKEFINDVFNSSYASPYKYPHPGGPTLSTKPSNWSAEEWKNYKNTLKDIAKAAALAAKSAPKP